MSETFDPAIEMFVGVDSAAALLVDRVLGMVAAAWEEGQVAVPMCELDESLRNEIDEGLLLPYIGLDGNLVVVQDSNLYSRRVLAQWADLNARLCRQKTVPLDESCAVPEYLGEDQRRAFEAVSSHTAVVITGGPGTGKSTLAKSIVELWIQSGLEQRDIALIAPTGKAAGRLASAIQGIERCSDVLVATMHRFLGLNKKWMKRSSVQLPFSAVLVDEASMIDLDLFWRLILALPEDCRLVVVGDPQQLPPIGPGAVLRNLLDTRGTELLKHIELKETFRQDQTDIGGASILRLAAAIQHNQIDDFTFVPDYVELIDDYEQVIGTVIEEFARPLTVLSDAVEMLAELDKHQILSPVNHGSFSVDDINDRIAHALDAQAGNPLHGQPIVVIKNDYEFGLVNGERGVVIVEQNGRARVVFEGSDGIRFFSWRAVKRFIRPAWAMTVHKSQGSEFEKVLLILSHTTDLLTRTMLYTAVTRARSRLILVGDAEALKLCRDDSLLSLLP